MPNISAEPLTGRAAFGPGVEAVLAADPHRPGSVDAVLLDRQERLTAQNRQRLYTYPNRLPGYVPGSRPELERIADEATDGATHPVQIAVALTRFVAAVPRRYPTPERSTAAGFYGDFGAFLCGGTEEEVLKKGSPHAAERARLLCALAQVAGLPARMVFLVRTGPVERHAVTEIFLTGKWSVFDGFSGRYFPWPRRGNAAAWEAQRDPRMVDQHPDRGRDRYVDSAYYHQVGIAAYDVTDFASYTYPWDPIPADLAGRLRQGLGG